MTFRYAFCQLSFFEAPTSSSVIASHLEDQANPQHQKRSAPNIALRSVMEVEMQDWERNSCDMTSSSYSKPISYSCHKPVAISKAIRPSTSMALHHNSVYRRYRFGAVPHRLGFQVNPVASIRPPVCSRNEVLHESRSLQVNPFSYIK